MVPSRSSVSHGENINYQERNMKRNYLRIQVEIIEFGEKEVIADSMFKDGTGADPYDDLWEH